MNKWLKISEQALDRALEIARNGDVPLQNIYHLAPLVYSEINKTNNDSVLNEMGEINEKQVLEDCTHDPKSIEQYKFHFVSSYLFGYVVAGKMDEFSYDRIMEYVTLEMDLFLDDYNIG